MLQSEIRVGHLYAIKVSGRICPVRVDNIRQTIVLGGKARKARYNGTNLNTGKAIQFTAAKCRFEYGKGLCLHRLSPWALCSLAVVPGTDRCVEHTA